MTLALIAAVARNRAIGRGNDLVWHDPADHAFFREATRGCPVVMGRRTWDSLPPRFRPLPGRRNVVVTRQAGFVAPGAEVVASLEQALQRLEGAPRVFVIGGAELYAQALPRADELLLTEVDADFDADTFFPAWDRARFDEVSRDERVGAGGVRFAFVTYRRRAADVPGAPGTDPP